MSTNVVYVVYEKKAEQCPRCESDMTDIQACHWLCTKCGAERDCSD